ncbi:RNA polymerase subunit sigma-70 [Halalkalibacillus sediminis]|uniref:RNA polymerase sigma factor n=1 Tax=Halalkalibacillus sediminis TaxID=2018042 RepID=A0A2I0QTK1_9BACI|nr:sigma-70 family RNA polymerase sigma factor [Halalkalibacillus sediminis]PKR77672.1 RNA polymerase subunit sigma-70 [Halalkalibacillus sediminis]
MSDRDLELYDAIQSGDKRALGELYEKYEKLLYSFAFKMTRNRELSEEVVQEVFIKIWTKKGIYQKKRGKFSSWILTVARNMAIDIMRKKKVQTYTLEERDSVYSEEPLTEELFEWKEDAGRVREAMGRLNEDQREVIHLFYFDALSQQKISERLGIPLGTVKGRIRLALNHLKKHLATIDERGGSRDE